MSPSHSPMASSNASNCFIESRLSKGAVYKSRYLSIGACFIFFLFATSSLGLQILHSSLLIVMRPQSQ